MLASIAEREQFQHCQMLKWRFKTIENALCSSGFGWSARGASSEVSANGSVFAM